MNHNIVYVFIFFKFNKYYNEGKSLFMCFFMAAGGNYVDL